jgi:hypothetical protein
VTFGIVLRLQAGSDFKESCKERKNRVNDFEVEKV